MVAAVCWLDTFGIFDGVVWVESHVDVGTGARDPTFSKFSSCPCGQVTWPSDWCWGRESKGKACSELPKQPRQKSTQGMTIWKSRTSPLIFRSYVGFKRGHTGRTNNRVKQTYCSTIVSTIVSFSTQQRVLVWSKFWSILLPFSPQSWDFHQVKDLHCTTVLSMEQKLFQT